MSDSLTFGDALALFQIFFAITAIEDADTLRIIELRLRDGDGIRATLAKHGQLPSNTFADFSAEQFVECAPLAIRRAARYLDE